MALVGRAELVRRAEALGHSELRVYATASGKRWVCQCSCGWGALRPDGRPSVTRATMPLAVEALQDHLWRALENDRRRRVDNGGVSLTHDVGRS